MATWVTYQKLNLNIVSAKKLSPALTEKKAPIARSNNRQMAVVPKSPQLHRYSNSAVDYAEGQTTGQDYLKHLPKIVRPL